MYTFFYLVIIIIYQYIYTRFNNNKKKKDMLFRPPPAGTYRLQRSGSMIYCIHILYLYTFFIVSSIYSIIIEQIFNRDVCHELSFAALFVIFIYRMYRYNPK